MSGVLKLGNVTLGTENNGKVDLTNVGTASADSVTATITNLSNSLTALDTVASNGATSNLDNTALPLFGCRAFVNFDGTSTNSVTVNGATETHCVIRSSGNVNKVVRTAQGQYTVHFNITMPDENYVVLATARDEFGTNGRLVANESVSGTTRTTSLVGIDIFNSNDSALNNSSIISVSIFR